LERPKSKQKAFAPDQEQEQEQEQGHGGLIADLSGVDQKQSWLIPQPRVAGILLSISVKCGRELAPDSGLSVDASVPASLLSGASSLPQFDLHTAVRYPPAFDLLLICF
jgi:hypothetical protein